MSGVWACKACAERLALDTAGQAVSLAKQNFCGASGHVVSAPVRWAPDTSIAVASKAAPGATVIDEASAIAPAVFETALPPLIGQGDLF